MDVLLKIKTWYSIHKWTSIFTGIALLMWFVTGIVMTSPNLIGAVYSSPEPAKSVQPDFQEVNMSPAEAIVHLENIVGQPVAVTSVHLKQVGDILAYQIVLTTGKSHLIDAQSGKEFVITPAFAEQLVRENYARVGNIVNVEYRELADLGNVFQSEPVYRIIFDDPGATYAHVSATTGAIGLNNRISRFLQISEVLHTFDILGVLTNYRPQIITVLVWLSSILTLFAAVNGYYLALPRRWQFRRKHR